jgi:hypothetical protein
VVVEVHGEPDGKGTTIARRREQVEAFIRACGGVDTYVEIWGSAWEQLRTVIHTDRTAVAGQGAVTPIEAEIVDKSSSPVSAGDHPSVHKRRGHSRFREPGYISYQRRTGGDPVLEPLDVWCAPGDREFIMVCGMGSRTIWIRWHAWTVEDARKSFRGWLGQPWQCLSTDLAGNALPNGFDFKTSRIDWFGLVD